MDFQETELQVVVPAKVVGPIKVRLDNFATENVNIPMATFESPLWHSAKRGAIVSQQSDGIYVSVTDEGISRSVAFYTENIRDALDCREWILSNKNLIGETVKSSGQFARLLNLYVEIVSNTVYLRINISTGDASGHNMVTRAADFVMDLVQRNCKVSYGSVSGNLCVDKKNSAINGILGRGKRCYADIVISREVCLSVLKTTPAKMVELNIKKNLLGSILAGSVRSANAHFANILLAVYLATGQDSANIIEGSQGVTFAELRGDNLYFSVTIPNVIVGTFGNGKDLDFAKKNLQLMGCSPEGENSSSRLAGLITAVTLCSELSLLAAQTNQGELMAAHVKLERGS